MSSGVLQEVTGSQAGYSGDDQIRICLRKIVELGGVAQTQDLYAAMEAVLNPRGMTLSFQGKSSVRFFTNRKAVEKGYIYPHDRANPGWRITPMGRELVELDVRPSRVSADVAKEADEPSKTDTVKDELAQQVETPSLLVYIDKVLSSLPNIDAERLPRPDGTKLMTEGLPHQVLPTIRSMMRYAKPGEVTLKLTVNSDGWHVALDVHPKEED